MVGVGNSYFQSQESANTLEKFFNEESIPDNQSPSFLDLQATILRIRFKQQGKIADITRAIEAADEAWRLEPLPDRIGNRGFLRGHRFERFRDTRDLSQAIAYLSEALDLMPDGSRERFTYQTLLGYWLCQRYRRFKAFEDLEKAIAHICATLQQTSRGDTRRLEQLQNLSSILSDHYH